MHIYRISDVAATATIVHCAVINSKQTSTQSYVIVQSLPSRVSAD